ncbi:MAG: hypothetical protein NTY77_19950 [Elusimicrobia bacterium]|nr:hypothetical protein [Elusimicrobiota bacterium]
MRAPLYLTFNVCLAALAGGGIIALIQRDTAAQAAQREALDRGLDALLASWTAGDTPPAGRVLRILVTGEPEPTWFDPPERRPLWWPLLSALQRGGRQAEHDRRRGELFGQSRLVCDWHEQGLAWASERRRRQRALAVQLAKAREAQARVVLVVDGRQAAAAWAAIQEAGAGAPEDAVVDKFIAFGAAAPGPARTPLVKERLLIWRSEGSMIEPAGNQMEFMDQYGRVARQPLKGDAFKQAGAIALLRDLIASDDELGGALVGVGQLPGSFRAPPPAPGPEPSELFALPRALEPEPKPVPAFQPQARPEPAPQAAPAAQPAERPAGLQLSSHGPTAEERAVYEKEMKCAACCQSAGGAWRNATYAGDKLGTVAERQPYWGCCGGADWPGNWASDPACGAFGNFGCGEPYSCGGICGGFRCVR